MGLWHRYAFLAYAAVFVAVIGHASSEFVSVLCKIGGPELSVWRFVLGSAGLIIISLLIPSTRNLIEPLRQEGIKLILLSLWGVSFNYQTRGSYLFYLKPVIAACLAVFILNQMITTWGILAIIIICGSVLVEPFLGRLGTARK